MWQVLQSLNVFVVISPVHSVQEDFFVPCKGVLHCGKHRAMLHKLFPPEQTLNISHCESDVKIYNKDIIT